MELSWTNIFLSSIPLIGVIGGAIIKVYVDVQVQKLRIKNIESKIEHINNNWKQRDMALMKEFKELKEEVHHLSIQIAEIVARNA